MYSQASVCSQRGVAESMDHTPQATGDTGNGQCAVGTHPTGILVNTSCDLHLLFTEAWKAVTDKVQDARANARLKQMSYAGVNGLSMFGLSHDAVVYLIEQLYGARNCRNYKFLFNDYEPVELEEVHPYVISTVLWTSAFGISQLATCLTKLPAFIFDLI